MLISCVHVSVQYVSPCVTSEVCEIANSLSALDPYLIHIDLTPWSSRTKLDRNWINQLWSYPHYEPNSVTIGTQGSIMVTVLAYLLLSVAQSCFWMSCPAGFGHCLLPIQQCACTVQRPQTLAQLPHDYFISGDNPLLIRIESTYRR